jgi:hypothetical protein
MTFFSLKVGDQVSSWPKIKYQCECVHDENERRPEKKIKKSF